MAKSKTTKEEKKTFKQRQDEIFQAVTDRILEQLDKGVIPWRKPWRNLGPSLDPSECAVSYEKGTPYSLLNQLILGRPGEWLTFNVIQKHGGRIKKGEKSSMIVFADRLVKADPDRLDENGEPTVIVIPYLKYYRVWHLDQTEGIESRLPKPGEQAAEPERPRLATAEEIVDGYMAQPSHPTLVVKTSRKACYSPLSDTVTAPCLEQYGSTAEYYSTLFHELAHSTGHRSRLARKGVTDSDGFGNHEYSKEELIAEMAAAMLMAQAGIETPSTLKNSSGYIQSWRRVLKQDNRIVVWAASGAEKAAKWILGIREAEKVAEASEGNVEGAVTTAAAA